jgi:hypothetical protein
MTIQQFITKHNIGADIKRIPFRLDNVEWEPNAKHYAFTISFDGKSLRGQYSQGSGIKTFPKCVDVLNALVCDASGIDGTSFDMWCGDYGYDTDSIKASETYRACLKESQDLKRVFGNLYTKLMECEQL